MKMYSLPLGWVRLLTNGISLVPRKVAQQMHNLQVNTSTNSAKKPFNAVSLLPMGSDDCGVENSSVTKTDVDDYEKSNRR